MKKLRSLVAAVVAVACLYTPTAAADPLSVELNALDSTIQVDGMAGNQPDGDAADGDQPDDNGVVESDGGALTSGSGEPTVESEGADTVPEGADATPGEGDGAADDGPTADTPQAVDWTNAVDNLRLSTQGLTITPSVPADGETDADIAGTSVIPEGLNGSGVSRGAALGGLAESQPEQQAKEGAAQLPDAIDATLNLTFTLDAAAGDGRTDGSGLGTIVAGDHFSVPMPEGLATADEGSALDVFARDTDGNTTTVRVAEAKASDGVLTVTFTEPADAQAREAVTASIDMPVTLDAALVQDEVSAIEWTVRTVEDAEGNRQPETLTINVPAKSDVMKTLGLVGTQDPESKENGESADKTDEASDETKKSQTTPNAAEPLADNALQPETTYALRGNKSVQLEVTWCDNNYGSRPTVDSLTNGYNPQFRIGDGKWTHLFDESGAISQDARTALHLGADETPSWATRTVRQTSVNTYIASASNLPDTLTTTTRVPVDANGDGVQDEDELGNLVWETKESPEQTITWLMDDTNTYPDEYQFGDNDDVHGEKPHRYLMLTSKVTFTVEGKIGGEKLSDIFKEEQKEFFQFGATIDNKDQGSGALADVAKQENLTITDNDANATITGRLPMYHENGDPIVYYITYTGPSPELEDSGYIEGTDYFQASYDNTNSASHGSASDAVYDGGTMMLRRMGITTYDADKVWLDGDNKENRPATSFTLWRYANNGTAGATTASQVQLNEVTTGTGEAQPNAIGYVSVEVPAQSGDSENSVDLGDLLIQKYGEGIRNLPKYDPDGYPYVYALREEGAPEGYEIVYGSVDPTTGKENDTAPNYEKVSYTDPNPGNEPLQGVTRPDDDPLVYNGGTITNRLTGTKKVSVTKTWEIAAFQDDLKNVEITFKAQSRVMGKYADDNTGWADVTGEHATHTEGGWKSETLTRTFSETFPKYNAFGEELEYRWVESGVKQGDKEIEFTPDEKGGGSFTLTLPTPDDEGTETLRFTSTFEAAKDEDGTDTITNTFENTTTEYVEKWWQQPDGSMKQIKPDPNGYPEYPDLDLSGEVTFGVYRDGELVGTFTMDGTSAKQASPLYKDGDDEVAEGFENATWQETASYDVTLKGLPKYSPEGKRYSYVVLEDPVDGWHTDRVYDAENHLTKVENTVGPGEGSEIRVMKKWVDGDDAAHRQPVVVQLVVTDKNGIRSEATNDDGTPKYEYAYGETVTAVSQDNNLTKDGQIILSADNSWFAEVEIPIGGLSYSQFKLVEVGLLQDDGTINPVVDSPAQAAEEYGADIVWGNVGWDYDDTKNTSRVANEHHVYETSAGADDEPQHNDAMRAVTASNRRIGLLDLTVTKLWQDGGDAENRPDARIELSCTEYADAFSIDDTGYVWVQVSDNRLPVNIPTGPNANDHRQLNTTDDKVSLDKKTGNLVMEIDSSAAGTEGTYHFFGLPKYDAQSAVVHYDVNEQWVGDHEGYASSKTTGEYVVGTQHFHDTQEFDFTNTRTGTRDVTFYKHWNDQYVNDQLKQRPDIYLTLYRVTVTGVDNEGNETYSDPVAVDGYVRWLWEPTDTDNPQYEQKTTVQSLPAYDGEGREYVYYASESMAVEDTASLDYAPVTFSYASLDDARLTAEQAGESYPGGSNAVWIGDGTIQGDPLSDGTNFAIHEDGTFVNALTGNLTATGTKLWMNVPGNVVQGADGNDLPGITIYLQRKLASDAEWPDLYFAVDENGSWSFKGERGAVAWTSHLVYQTNNQYSYTLTHVGENGADPANEDGELLARYDANGEQYQYRAIEVPWGMCNQPGGFDPTDIDGKAIDAVNFADLRDSEIDQLGVIVIAHGETGSFRITNVYDSPKGSLTVKKLFSGREAGDRYPSTTFDVYRYYVNGQGVASEAEQVARASHTLTNDELSQVTTDNNANPKVTQTGGNNANNTAEYTFSGLDIYAPDGSYWQYYVVERAIGGYTTTVGVGDLSASAATDTGMDRGEAIAGISSPDLCDEQAATESTSRKVTGTVLAEDKVAQDGTVTPGDTKPDVTFKNEYKPETANLQGTKSWIDYGNIFGVRPSFEEFRKSLKVERIGNGKTENITKILQSTNADGANYLAVTQAENPNDFTITLSKVEKWAPDGTPWQYRITETLSGMTIAATGADGTTADDFYKEVGTSSTVSTTSGAQFRLTNRFYGEASVEKTWDDGDDPYGLRPTTVTVRLQARTNDGTNTGAWTDAYDLLSTLVEGGETTLGNAGLNDEFFSKKLTANNGWKAAWQNLPAAAMRNNAVVHLEYRAVETMIGDVPVTPPTGNAAVSGQGNAYGIVSSYKPSQETTYPTSGDATHVGTTTITNTLVPTGVSVKKVWSDKDNAWDTRGNGGTWTVSYLLQRTTDNTNWEWVTQYGETLGEGDDLFSDKIVGGTVTNESKDLTYTWSNLPLYSSDNETYTYRVVERVPGSYDVTDLKAESVLEDKYGNPIAEEHGGVEYRYYVVPGDTVEGALSYTFTNTLRTVNLQGTKLWNDYGTGLADDLTTDDMPKLTLKRKAGNVTETVKYVATDDGQPTWGSDGNGTFTFLYEGMPEANSDNVSYTYWAEETDGASDGYYPLYGTGDSTSGTSHGADATTENDYGLQTNETITNTATRFTLDKVSDDWDPVTTGDQQETVNDVELTITKDGKTFAVWARDAQGVVSSKVWPEGTTNTAQGGKTMTDDNAGYIIGLPAGAYTVIETKTPAGFAQARSVTITIAANGAVTASGVGLDSVGTVSDVADAAGTAVVKVTVEDQILRGHLQLTKYLSADGSAPGSLYSDATFDLYSVDLDKDGNPELIAAGLKPQDGVLTTVGNSIEIKKESSNPNNQVDLTHGGRYITLADGLPEGEYFFRETSVGPDAVKPGTSGTEVGVDSDHLTITQERHYAFTNAPVATAKGNEVFNATVKLPKYDTTSTEGIENAEFELRYRPEGAEGTDYPVQVKAPDGSTTFKTDKNGLLTLPDLEKGHYQLVETANPGYAVPADGRIIATFILDDADDDKTFDMTQSADREAVSFTAYNENFDVEGSYNNGEAVQNPAGIPNDRLPGSVAINKTGMNPEDGTTGALNGATFKLEVKSGQEWKMIAEGLKTGNTYEMAYGEDDAYQFSGAGKSDTNGRITVTNLIWGTYRFVEIATTDGHINPTDADVSGEIVVGRYTLNPATTGDNQATTIENKPTKLEIIKVGPDSTTKLQGAKFLIEAAPGSSLANGEDDVVIVTNADGAAALEGQLVVGDTYTLTEQQAPNTSYELVDGKVTFTVKDNGELEVQGDLPEGYVKTEGTNNAFSFTVTNSYFELNIQKTGDTQNISGGAAEHPFQGARFTLTGEGYNETLTTDENGRISITSGLKTGVTYTLTETTAPAGFTPAAGSFRFQLDERGNIVGASGSEAFSADSNTVTITATDVPTSLTITKYNDDQSAKLPDAEFSIKPAADDDAFVDGAEQKTLTTGVNGTTDALVGQLIVGDSYTIEETKAPEGYELIADGFIFTVNDDGTIKLANGQQTATDGAEGYRIEDDNIAITAQDTPIEVKLKKQAESGKALAGAVFKVTPADDSSFVNKELNASGVTLVASAANGTVDTAALDAQLIAGNSYVIEEVTPPAGYEKIAGTLTFTVDADGKISAAADVTNDPAFVIDTDDDVMTITATDKPVEVILNKVGADNAKLDATFTLKGIFASANMDGTVEADEPTPTITVKDGIVTLDRLVVGNTYVLQETKSQAGYEVITGTFTFTVNENGTITPATEGNDTAYAVADGNIAITATNTPVQITVTKVDEDNKPLEGAEFTLTGDFANADGTVKSNHEWTVKPGTDPATIDGLIVTNDENRHEYTLTETTAPAGYEKLGSITFTINRDGTIAGTGAGYTVDGNGINITAQDTAIKARLMKTDENNQPQAGATFAIEPAAGSAFADGKTDPVEFTTGEGGVIDLTDAWLVGGNTYTITEVTAPNGYELAGTVTFKVNENGTIDLIDADGKPVAAITETDGSGSYLASADNGVAVITATNSPIAVQMVKQSDGTPLAGATFELTPADGFTFADGSTEAQTITIESTSGATALTNLTANMTYILKETVPPAGYELNETEFTFTVATDGTIVSTDADGYTVSGSEIITITVNDEPIEVTLTKRNADGAALDGAEFTLHGMFANADGTPSGTVADRTVVVENGTVALEGLIADQQYTLTETKAPEGYRVNTGTLTFTVNTDGTLTEIESVEGYTIEADATAITVTDQPTELDLTKLAADGTPLVGAEFTLAPDTEHDADSRFVSGQSSIDLVIGEDGTVPTITGELIAGHAYVLTETKAPDGYALITESLHFTVGRKGRAASVTAGTELPNGYTIGGNREAGTIALTAVDNPIELTLKKVNEDGDVLVGAEFTLSGRFADGTTQQILTTGADGTVALPLIIGGERYVLEETKAPEGYVLPAERYTFTVGVDGVIRVQQNLLAALLPGDKTFSLSQDGLTITVVNEREPVVAITGSDVTSVGFIGFGLLLIGATIAMQRRTRMAQVAGNGKPARGRHRR